MKTWSATSKTLCLTLCGLLALSPLLLVAQDASAQGTFDPVNAALATAQTTAQTFGQTLYTNLRTAFPQCGPLPRSASGACSVNGPDLDADGNPDVIFIETRAVSGTNNRGVCTPVQTDLFYTPSGTSITDASGVSAQTSRVMVYSSTPQSFSGSGAGCPSTSKAANTFVTQGRVSINPTDVCKVAPLQQGSGPCQSIEIYAEHGGQAPTTSVNGYALSGRADQLVRVEHFTRTGGAFNNGDHVVVRFSTVNKDSDPTTFALFPLGLDLGNIHLVSTTNTATHDFDDDGQTDQVEILAGSNPLNDKSTPTDFDGDGTPNNADDFPSDRTKDHAFPYTISVPSISSSNGGRQIFDAPPAGHTVTGDVTVGWTAQAPSGSYLIRSFSVGGNLRDSNGNPSGFKAIATNLDPATVCTRTGTSYSCTYLWHSNLQSGQLEFGKNYWVEVDAVDAADDAGKVPASGFGRSSLYFGYGHPPVSLSVVDANGKVDNSAAGFYSGDLSLTYTAFQDEVGQQLDIKLSQCTSGGASTIVSTTIPAAGANTVTLSTALFNGFVDCGTASTDPQPNTGVISVTLTEIDGGIHTGSISGLRIHNNVIGEIGANDVVQTDVGDATALGSGTGAAVRFVAYYNDQDGDMVKSATAGCAKGGPKSFKVVVSQGGIPVKTQSLAPPRQTDCTASNGIGPSGVSVDPNSGVDNGDYYFGPVPWSAIVALAEGSYTYHYEAVDSDGNRADDRAPNEDGPAVSSDEKSLVVSKSAIPTTGDVQKAIADAQAQVLAFAGCPGETPQQCAGHVGNDRLEGIFADIEESAHCDFEGHGNPPVPGEPKCMDVPGAVIGSIIQLASEKAGEVLTFVTDTAQGAISSASKQGIPNVNAVINCDTSIQPASAGQQVCPPGDSDHDGFTDAQENGISDPNNPFSTPNDRDADLVPESLETFVDLQLYAIHWVNADNGATCSSNDCVGRLDPTPNKHITVWAASGFTSDRRVGTLLNVEQSVDGTIRISTQGGYGLGGNGLSTLTNGRIHEASWTVGRGLFDVVLEGGKIYVKVMAEDQEPIITLIIDPSQLAVPDGKVVDMHLLGGRLAQETNGQGDDTFGGGTSMFPAGARVSVTSNPMNVIINEPIRIGQGWIEDGILGAPFTPPEHCTPPPGDEAPQGDGSWVIAEQIGVLKYRVCGQMETGLDVPIPLGSYDVDFLPIVGIAVKDGNLVPWMDQNGNGVYDDGEEIGTGVPPPPSPDLGCKPGESADACAVKKVIGTLCGDREMSQADCLNKLRDGALDAVHTLTGCDADDTECLDLWIAKQAQCNMGEHVEECASRTVADAASNAGAVEDVVRGALDCPDGQETADCVQERLDDVGGAAMDIVDGIVDTATTAIATVVATATGLANTILGVIGNAGKTATDFDGDGYSNDLELRSGTNPFHANSNPAHPGAGFPTDWDGDGYSNDFELRAGGDPFHECSTPENQRGIVTSC